MRGRLVHAGGGGPIGAQQAPQVVGLLGPVDDTDLPGLGEQPGQELAGSGGVGLVDQAEVRFEPVEHLRIGVQESLVAAEHGLEHGLPPGEFELVGHVFLRHVAPGQVGHQRVEVVLAQGGKQRGALVQVREHLALRGQAGDRVDELLDRAVRQLTGGAGRSERDVEARQVFRDALVGHVHVRDAHRHLGGDAGNDEALPHSALLLDTAQALVHITHVHAGAQVFHGEFAQAATAGAGHVG